MIPKRIFSIWLNEKKEFPPLMERCIKSHKLPGYEHRLITLDNCYRGSRYVNECLASKNWVKASDFLRMHYLYMEGGIYLDADMKVLKNFDDMLENKLFVCREENNFIANSAVGSVKEHPLLGEYLNTVENNYRGDGNLIFEVGMGLFTDFIYKADVDKMGIKIYEPEYFFPYNHQTGKINKTKNTRVWHYFAKSWVKEDLPMVSIVIPTLGREEKLKGLLEKIKENADYPNYEVIVERDSFKNRQGAPKTFKKGVKRSKGELVMYLGNDCVPEKGFLRLAVDKMMNTFPDMDGLVGLNDGYWKGEVATHFLASKKLL